MTPTPTLVEKMRERAEGVAHYNADSFIDNWDEITRAALAVVMAEMREPSNAVINAGYRAMDANIVPIEEIDLRAVLYAMLAVFEREPAGG